MDFNKLITSAKNLGFSDVELYSSHSKETEISFFNGVVEKNEIHDTTVYTIRGIFNGKMSNLTFENENVDIDSLLKKLKENAASLTTLEEFEIYEGSKDYPEVEKRDGGFANIPLDEKINLLKSLEKAVKDKDDRIVSVPYCQYAEETSEVRIVNSKGLNLEKSNEYSLLAVQAVAKDGEDTQDSFEIKVALKYSDFDVEEIAAKVVKEAISMLNATSIPSKKYPIIFERDAMRSLFGAFSSMFSGEAAIKKLTSLVGKENTKIMSDKVTIIDDPLYLNGVNVHPFDDEGVACYKKEVVKDGVFTTLLHNLKTARYFKTTSTGNGFKAGAAVGVRGMNFYIMPGEKTKEELIESVQEGLLITSVSGLHAGVNPISGDFSAQSSGYLIENGKISRPVTLIVVSGNFIKMMNEIEEIGNDLKVSYNGIGAPSIKFTGLPVSGE